MPYEPHDHRATDEAAIPDEACSRRARLHLDWFIITVIAVAIAFCLISTFANAQTPNLALYLAQARCPNGSPPVTSPSCQSLTTQRFSDPIHFRRSDGHDQIVDAVETGLTTNGLPYFQFNWSYPPHAAFVAANGDGGEVYTTDGTTVWICCTQDGSTQAMQMFGRVWPLFNSATSDCASGWTKLDDLNRACRTVVTYATPTTPLVADTIINEHYSGPNQTLDLERHFLAAGWGMLYWDAYSQRTPRPALPPAPAGAPVLATPLPRSDARLWTTIVPQLPSVASYGWPPTGSVPAP